MWKDPLGYEATCGKITLGPIKTNDRTNGAGSWSYAESTPAPSSLLEVKNMKPTSLSGPSYSPRPYQSDVDSLRSANPRSDNLFNFENQESAWTTQLATEILQTQLDTEGNKNQHLLQRYKVAPGGLRICCNWVCSGQQIPTIRQMNKPR